MSEYQGYATIRSFVHSHGDFLFLHWVRGLVSQIFSDGFLGSGYQTAARLMLDGLLSTSRRGGRDCTRGLGYPGHAAGVLPNVLRATSRQSQHSSQREVVASQAQPTAALLAALNSDIVAPFKMIDTLSAEEASKFYPKGLPSNFNYQTKKNSSLPMY